MSRARQPNEDLIRVRGNLHSVSLLAVILSMGYAGAVQSNGAAYLLAFLTASLGAISYIHARANVKGLKLRTGALPAGQAGRKAMVPVEICSCSGASAHGLEVLVIGSPKATLVESIPGGESARVSLVLPAHEEGTQQRVRLLVRSSYPLGLFSAERVIEVVCLRRVHPRPAGDLPLPASDAKARQAALALSGNATVLSREGDDFAGLREWQKGDSPRHIDWRSAERGRPLMVKAWAANAAEAVRLNWDEITLPNQERSSQMAKWIELCEARNRPYAMSLPGVEIPVGVGTAHAQRCLNALADLNAQSSGEADTQEVASARIPASYERSAHLPKGPLALLSVTLLLAALPLWESVASASIVVLMACLLWRGFQGRQRLQAWAPVAIAVLGIAAILFTQESLMSMEAGIAVLLVLLGAKLIESRTPHDFQVLAMVGWFLCLCGVMSEQSLGRSLYTFAVFIGIALCMVRFRRSTPGIRAPLRLTGVFFAQALPIAMVVFLVFPRGSFDYLARFGNTRLNKTGIPTELNPADISKIALSTDIAFHVKFPNGEVPLSQNRYWRCVVLWECEGMHWGRGPALEWKPKGKYHAQAQDVRQVIDLEPHNQYWLPSLDRPQLASDSGGSIMLEGDDTLRSAEPVRSMRHLSVVSRPFTGVEELPAEHRAAALQVPGRVPERMRALANQWRAGARSDFELVQTGLNYLKTQGFSYTLNPGEYREPDALEEFWFKRRVGFCGHFSAAFATMMRLSGVPTRVVMGYLGGEWSDMGSYMIVRQSDAHAWMEVWLDASGWTRVDPTGVLAPNRLNADMQTFLLGEDSSGLRNNLWFRITQNVQLFWDHISYQWFNYVVGFDEELQWNWLSWLGLGHLMNTGLLRGPLLLSISALLMALALVVLALWLRRPARHRDPWARAWQKLCRRLVRLGLPPRELNEGPLAYAERVGHVAPKYSVRVRALAGTYAAARYGGAVCSLKEFRRNVRELKKL